MLHLLRRNFYACSRNSLARSLTQLFLIEIKDYSWFNSSCCQFQLTYRLSLLQMSNCYYFCHFAHFSWSSNPFISWYQVTSRRYSIVISIALPFNTYLKNSYIDQLFYCLRFFFMGNSQGQVSIIQSLNPALHLFEAPSKYVYHCKQSFHLSSLPSRKRGSAQIASCL